ncbi:MAG: hypothetical protein AABY09_05185 [Nanoarchaeota archaeon]
MYAESIDHFFEAADGYPEIPRGREVYIVCGEKALEELKEKLKPFAPRAPLKSNVPALVDICLPWHVEELLEEQMKRAAHHFGGNLFYVPEGNYCLKLTSGIAVGEVYLMHLTENNNPFRP